VRCVWGKRVITIRRRRRRRPPTRTRLEADSAPPPQQPITHTQYTTHTRRTYIRGPTDVRCLLVRSSAALIVARACAVWLGLPCAKSMAADPMSFAVMPDQGAAVGGASSCGTCPGRRASWLIDGVLADGVGARCPGGGAGISPARCAALIAGKSTMVQALQAVFVALNGGSVLGNGLDFYPGLPDQNMYTLNDSDGIMAEHFAEFESVLPSGSLNASLVALFLDDVVAAAARNKTVVMAAWPGLCVTPFSPDGWPAGGCAAHDERRLARGAHREAHVCARGLPHSRGAQRVAAVRGVVQRDHAGCDTVPGRARVVCRAA
jgi:hypothetical protein